MSKTLNTSSKPGMSSLLTLFLIAAAIPTIGAYAYVWTHDLTPKDAQVYTVVGAALSTPFGIAVAVFWRFFHDPLTRAAEKVRASARPVSKRLVDSWAYNTVTLIFLCWSMATTESWIVIVFGTLVCLLSVFNLWQILKKKRA